MYILLLNPKDILWWSVGHSQVTDKDRLYIIGDYFCWINEMIFILSIGAWFILLARRNISKEGFFGFCMMSTVFVNLFYTDISQKSSHAISIIYQSYAAGSFVVLPINSLDSMGKYP